MELVQICFITFEQSVKSLSVLRSRSLFFGFGPGSFFWQVKKKLFKDVIFLLYTVFLILYNSVNSTCLLTLPTVKYKNR